ncbi:MAG TPA: NUDIX domain-containing protein [Phototrophicaceae bacterium]|nr:NUDIX domain-containing protein [Phototrophicaceae bacterium]
MNGESVGKVTAFITRETGGGRQLLVLRHPSAGIQLPAGTIEADETPEAAVLREVREETGLTAVEIVAHLETVEQVLEGQARVVTAPYNLELEPGDSARIIARLSRGAAVQRIEEFYADTQVWCEFRLAADGVLRPVTGMRGWLPTRLLTNRVQRAFFHLIPTAPTPERWTQEADHHTFELYWADLSVQLVTPQQAWLERMRNRLAAE